MVAWDRTLFRWINDWPESLSPIFIFFSEAIKTAPVRVALIVFILAMLFGGRNTRRAILLALLAWPLANGFSEALKWGFQWERPCVELADVNLYVKKLTSFGTASSHSANMAAVATVLSYYWRPWGYVWIPIAVLTGLSRSYVGVHYPSQVMLGWITGVFCGVLVIKTWEAYLKVRGSVTKSEGATEQP